MLNAITIILGQYNDIMAATKQIGMRERFLAAFFYDESKFFLYFKIQTFADERVEDLKRNRASWVEERALANKFVLNINGVISMSFFSRAKCR